MSGNETMIFWFMRGKVLTSMVRGDVTAAWAWSYMLAHYARKLEARRVELEAVRVADTEGRRSSAWLN